MAEAVEDTPIESQEATEPKPPFWRELWQAPALAGAVVLLCGALVYAVVTRGSIDISARLDRCEALIESRKFLEAIDSLNGQVFPSLAKGKVSPGEVRRFHLLLARALYRGQKDLGLDKPENHKNILRSYEEAIAVDALLESSDFYALADTQLSLGDTERALRWAERLPPEDAPRAREIRRRVVERELKTAGSESTEILGLLSTMLEEANQSDDERAWVVQVQGSLLLQSGMADEAIARLLREMQRLDRASGEARSKLHLLLARAYVEGGATAQASTQLDFAEGLMLDTDPARSTLAYLRGLVDDAAGDLESARDRYALIVDEMGASDESLPSMLRLGEVEASLGHTAESLDAFTRLIGAMEGHRTHPDVSRERVVRGLLRLSDDRLERRELTDALAFARKAERLMGIDERPSEVFLAVARAERALADVLIGDRPTIGVPTLRGLDPASREEARRHLIAAGSNYRQHANRMILPDYQAYGDSLWMSADSFDLAGDSDEAVGAYQEFINSFPEDPRRAEARFRLGRAYQGRGELQLASDLFQGLVNDRNDPQVKGVGLWGDLSYVPLAQVLLDDADASNDARAEQLLLSVVDGTVVREPDAAMYRDGVVALADFYSRSGQDTRAIARYDEAIDRFPDDPERDLLRFHLAESCRREGDRLRGLLEGSIPESERQRLESLWRERTARAGTLYAATVEALSQRSPAHMSAVVTRALRDASFYAASCAFDLGDYDAAIRAYDEAYTRYPRDPASLVALVQIVNAQLAMGQSERARASNERARRFFESIPDEAWNDPYLPMGRDDWERWLESSARLASVSDDQVFGNEDGTRMSRLRRAQPRLVEDLEARLKRYERLRSMERLSSDRRCGSA
ncbi:MAG: tetratricopeptide repeat protein [Phycisphaeraceae bacterium]|nr:tetratricopeptide repeat protein [Phycisphaeraceae bacterium]